MMKLKKNRKKTIRINLLNLQSMSLDYDNLVKSKLKIYINFNFPPTQY